MTLKTSKINISGLTYEFEDLGTKEQLSQEILRAENQESVLKSDIKKLSSETQQLTNKLSQLNGTGEGSIQGMINTAISETTKTAPEVIETIQNIGEWIEGDTTGSAALIKEVQNLEDTKADREGYHPRMTVGFTDNMVGRGETSSADFIFRPTAGSDSIDDGAGRIEKIKGNTIVWNQLCKNGEDNWGGWSYNSKSCTRTINSDGSMSILGVPKDGYTFDPYCDYRFASIAYSKHKYLFQIKHKLSADPGTDTATSSIIIYGPKTTQSFSSSFNGGNYNIYTWIGEINPDSSNKLFRVYNKKTTVSLIVRDAIMIDLTLMFGFGNEPTTVEEFYNCFSINSYKYNVGQLVSSNPHRIETTGFNLLNLSGRKKFTFDKGYTPQDIHPFSEDEYWMGIAFNGYAYGSRDNFTKLQIKDNSVYFVDTNYSDSAGYGIGFPVRVIPKTKYYLGYTKSSGYNNVNVGFFDKDGRFIEHGGGGNESKLEFTTTDNTYWIVIVMGVGSSAPNGNVSVDNLNLNFYHTGYRNGEVEPYKEYYRELPEVTKIINPSTGEALFPDGLRGAGNVYDEITSTHAIKRVGCVDLGTLTYIKREVSDLYPYGFFYNVFSDARFTSDNNIICSKYGTGGGFRIDKSFFGNSGSGNGTFYIVDSAYSDVDSLKSALQGIYMYYELKTPIVVELDEPFNMDYSVWDFGTERIVPSVIPSSSFRADITYGFNAVDTVRNNKLGVDEFKAFMDKMKAGLGVSSYDEVAERMISLLGSIPTVTYEE